MRILLMLLIAVSLAMGSIGCAVVPVVPVETTVVVEPFYDGPYIIGGFPYYYYNGAFFVFEGGFYRFHHHCPPELRGHYHTMWNHSHREHLRARPPSRHDHRR